jgi:hypothetical protein
MSNLTTVETREKRLEHRFEKVEKVKVNAGNLSERGK